MNIAQTEKILFSPLFTSKLLLMALVGANNNKLKVGHGMCSGAFIFKQKGKYKVRFTPMNIDGQELTKTEWKTFESPFASNKNKLGF